MTQEEKDEFARGVLRDKIQDCPICFGNGSVTDDEGLMDRCLECQWMWDLVKLLWGEK